MPEKGKPLVAKGRGRMRLKSAGTKNTSNYTFSLEWEKPFFHYKKGLLSFNYIDLRKVHKWDTFKAENGWQGVSLTTAGKTRYEIELRENQFPTWLYWLLISIFKHRKVDGRSWMKLGTSSKLAKAGLSPHRRGKLLARRDYGKNDMRDALFVNALENIPELPDEPKNIRAGLRKGSWECDLKDMLSSGTGSGAYLFKGKGSRPGRPQRQVVVKLIYLRPGNDREMLKAKSVIWETRIIKSLETEVSKFISLTLLPKSMTFAGLTSR